MHLTLLWFLDFATVYSVAKYNVFLFNVGNKIFCFFKKWVFPLGRGYSSRWGMVKFSKILRKVAHKMGVLLCEDFFFLGGGGGLGKKGWGQYFRVRLIPWRTLWKYHDYSFSFVWKLEIYCGVHNGKYRVEIHVR